MNVGTLVLIENDCCHKRRRANRCRHEKSFRHFHFLFLMSIQSYFSSPLHSFQLKRAISNATTAPASNTSK
jgi:hypothetical protein